MFTLDVPKDVRNVQSKVIGPFTFRQTIWGGIGIASAYLSVAFQKAVFGPEAELNTGLLFLFCVIPAVIGFIPIMDMPAEKFFKYVFYYYTTPMRATYFVTNPVKKEIRRLADAEETEEKKVRELAMKADPSFRKSELRKEKQMLKTYRREEREYNETFEKMA